MKGMDRSPAAPGTLQEAGPLARLLPEWSVIPIIAGLFVLAFCENVGYLNVDDLNAIISDSPTEIYAQISLQDGRYLLVAALRAFKAFDIDGLLDYAVFAALYAFAFAWFCQAAVAYLTRDAGLRPEIVRAWTVLFGALLLTHGFFSDLIAWKIAYPVMLLMLLPVAACLELLARRPLTPRLCLALAALMLLANMAYQPGTTAVLFLAFAWVLVTALSPGSRQGGALRPYLVHVGMIVAAYVAAGAAYVLLTRVVRVVEGIDSARPFALSPLHLVPNHVYHYARQVIGVFDPTGYMGDAHAGGPLALVASVLVVALAWLGFKRGRLLPVLAGLAGLGLLLSNPQNLLMENYYPSGRSSFLRRVLPAGALACSPCFGAVTAIDRLDDEADGCRAGIPGGLVRPGVVGAGGTAAPRLCLCPAHRERDRCRSEHAQCCQCAAAARSSAGDLRRIAAERGANHAIHISFPLGAGRLAQPCLGPTLRLCG